ncbi:MAG: class I SAM-dependent methyltransferase [Caulobacterales bacterium]
MTDLPIPGALSHGDAAWRPQCDCPVCGDDCAPLDVVDFNKSCEEYRSKFLPLSGTPIYYYLCEYCGFCFAPSICQWTPEEFSRRIYNADYAEIDPDYLDVRPRGNAAFLSNLIGSSAPEINHLDYGGGNGLLSSLLREAGWRSQSCDPYGGGGADLAGAGKFDLISAFEVFEHVSNPRELISTLTSLLNDSGVIIFSTLVSDGHIAKNQRLNWWYASPRNGHISLFSKNSLHALGRLEQLVMGSFSENTHLYVRPGRTPEWAKHFINFTP